jgi:hypothetical protein
MPLRIRGLQRLYLPPLAQVLGAALALFLVRYGYHCLVVKTQALPELVFVPGLAQDEHYL